jgi:hypothetical protein
MATLAFCVAIGGTGYAASKIDGGQIKAGTIKGKALKKRTVPGSKVRPDALTGRQVKEAKLGEVPAAARADSAGSAATLGGLTATQLTDDCPAGTLPYAGACIEEDARAALPWDEAAEVCGDAGRRLPALDELLGFRREPGITLGNGASPEHVSLLFDSDGNPADSDGFVTVALRENGTISTGFAYESDSAAQFRCVAPLTNR